MAFGFFLNMEKANIIIIESELNKMTDDNISSQDELYVNGDRLSNNIVHGIVVCTMIVNLIEAAVNTIISRQMSCLDEDILKASFEIKLHMICYEYGADYSAIKSNHAYGKVREVIRVRNDLVHYKTNYLGDASWISADIQIPMGTSKKTLVEIFTKKQMQEYYNNATYFLDLLCKECSLVINRHCEVIDCDAKDELCEFIYDKH